MKRNVIYSLILNFYLPLFVVGFFFWACGESPGEGKANANNGSSLLESSKSISNDKSNANRNPSSDGGNNTASQVVLFFGDSLTAGLGLPSQDYAWCGLLIEQFAKEGYSLRGINAGLSGDTTSGGLNRLDWALQNKVDVFVLELGANDSMRGIPVPLVKKNLIEIIRRVKNSHPKAKILLIGMRTFPNLGADYRSEFDRIYKEIAKSEKVLLVPFILESVAGIRRLNQEDGIHPTIEGHQLMAKTVYPYLKKLILKK
jgi:acyl-CoA thioesterase-1